jgi:hypothetical protein
MHLSSCILWTYKNISKKSNKTNCPKDMQAKPLLQGTYTTYNIRNASDWTTNTKYYIPTTNRMETKGIEPSFPRCDRGVLPLHYVPKNINTIHSNSWVIKVNITLKLYTKTTYDNLKLPLIVTHYLLNGLPPRLTFAISRITNRH